jgi:hypothetical protein
MEVEILAVVPSYVLELLMVAGTQPARLLQSARVDPPTSGPG